MLCRRAKADGGAHGPLGVGCQAGMPASRSSCMACSQWRGCDLLPSSRGRSQRFGQIRGLGKTARASFRPSGSMSSALASSSPGSEKAWPVTSMGLLPLAFFWVPLHCRRVAIALIAVSITAFELG